MANQFTKIARAQDGSLLELRGGRFVRRWTAPRPAVMAMASPPVYTEPRVRLKTWVWFVLAVLIVGGIAWLVMKYFAESSNPLASTVPWRTWRPA